MINTTMLTFDQLNIASFQRMSKRELLYALQKQKLRKKGLLNKSPASPPDLQNQATDEEGAWLLEMEAWQEIGVSTAILKGLFDCGFKKPTPVQSQAIPVTMETDSDIIGAAETVSWNYFKKIF